MKCEAAVAPLADTSFHGIEARWKKMIANQSMVGHHWASMSITAGEKETDRLHEATLNRFWNRMTLNRTPMPPGGYALARGDFSQMEQWGGQVEGETN